MSWQNVNWKVILDQLHNILIAGGAIVATLGFSATATNNVLGYGGLVLSVVGAIVSGANVQAASTAATGVTNVPNASTGNAPATA